MTQAKNSMFYPTVHPVEMLQADNSPVKTNYEPSVKINIGGAVTQEQFKVGDRVLVEAEVIHVEDTILGDNKSLTLSLTYGNVWHGRPRILGNDVYSFAPPSNRQIPLSNMKLSQTTQKD